MSVITVTRSSKSVVGQVKSYLIISVILLIVILIFRLMLSIIVSKDQYDLNIEHTTVQSDITGILTSMIDQETGLRGYIVTANPTFLEPFNRGRPQYLHYLQDLKNVTNSSGFANTRSALLDTVTAANTWYTAYAQSQLANMQARNFALARSESTSKTGKSLFDQFRVAEAALQAAANRDIDSLQTIFDNLNTFTIVFSAVLSLLVILILWRMFTRFAKVLRNQLNVLSDSILRLSRGDLSARVQPLASKELNLLGETFNSMAATVQEQQKALYDRDVLENVQQLNTMLNQSLDLDALLKAFLNEALVLLGLQLAALYLYNPQRKVLSLTAAHGFDEKEMQKEFRLSEGVVGLAAFNHKPLYLLRPDRDEAEGLAATTIFGKALPTSIYHLPLLRAGELVGVLSVASIYTMKEQTRNVLNVVADSLAATINNIRAYQHIRFQAEDLVRYTREQERSNNELRRQRDELTVLNTALEEANRVRSQFLSTMSHELRTPLAAIIGFGQMVLRDLEQMGSTQNTMRQCSNMERILKNSKHLLNLINGVLDLAKIESGRMNVAYSQIDLNELLHSVVEETQSIAIEQKLTVKVVVEEGMGTIETDQVKLRQILLNLISNAMKFTPSGEVVVSARPGPASRVMDERVIITVADTGIGIAPELQENIFEAFFQADSSMTRKFGGTGLGLAIVRQLTTLLEGKLELHSEPGKGSIFTITLPVKPPTHAAEYEDQPSLSIVPPTAASAPPALEEPAIHALSAPSESTAEADNRPVLLAVDDNPDTVNLIATALEQSPFCVIGVQDPHQVLELVQRYRPCAITLDIMMPDLNGWQILYHLKSSQETASIPVIVLTVLTERTTGYVLGADDYLVKPFDRETLLKTLYRLTEYKTPVTSEAQLKNAT